MHICYPRGKKYPSDVAFLLIYKSKYTSTDAWFHRVETKTHPLILDSAYTNTGAQGRIYETVKIAILDSGIALKANIRPKGISKYIANFKDAHLSTYDGIGPSNEDGSPTGHGTNVAVLAARVCPNADYYVARVTRYKKTSGHSEDEVEIKPSVVADAIKWAMKKKVDIINMSFGWQSDQPLVEDAIEKAHKAGILLFAATSNEGAQEKSGMAYPARDSNVIRIDSAHGDGSTSTTNPLDKPSYGMRFSAPGINIPSIFPTTRSGVDETFERLEGASFACPIAAGVAGLILEFARQEPLSLEPRIAQDLKTPRRMSIVLYGLSAEFNISYTCYFLRPWVLFETTTMNGGDAYEQDTPRMKAAVDIIRYLRNLDDTYGREMYRKLNERGKKS
jgi:subtilisin family serine protease